MRNRVFVLELNSETQSVTGWGFPMGELEAAISRYQAREEDSRENPRVDVVLVSTDSLSALRRVYPNYFTDIREFSRVVAKVIGKQ